MKKKAKILIKNVWNHHLRGKKIMNKKPNNSHFWQRENCYSESNVRKGRKYKNKLKEKKKRKDIQRGKNHKKQFIFLGKSKQKRSH